MVSHNRTNKNNGDIDLMPRAAITMMRKTIIRNKNAKHIRRECPDFPEIIPEPEEKSE